MINFDMTNEEYHSHTNVLSASGTKTIAFDDLATFKYAERKESAAFDVGTATHTLVLQPELSDTIWMGAADRRGLAWKKTKLEAEEAGALLLTEGDYLLAHDMAEAVRANKAAAELLSGDLVCEASVFAKHEPTGIDIRCRPDGWRRDIGALIDLKTTITSDPAGFAKQCANFGYHVQDQHYRMTMEAAGFEIDRFVFIAVQKSKPHRVGVFELDHESLVEGRAACQYAFEKFSRAQETNEWGYNFGDLQTIQIPRYSFQFSQIG